MFLFIPGFHLIRGSPLTVNFSFSYLSFGTRPILFNILPLLTTLFYFIFIY